MLEVAGLKSRYGRIEVLHGVDLEVAKGETVAIVGANGAGKTTLLKCLSGVQPVSAGRIRLDGEDITSRPAFHRVARGLTQSPEGRQIFTDLSVEDNLRLGAFRAGRERMAENMEAAFGLFPVLRERRGQTAGGLSGGQQQMLALARALMADPKCLLLDEPSMGLAPALVDQIFSVVEELKSRGITVLLVEQNAVAALSIAERAYVLENGRIAMSGDAAALARDDRVRAAYLGV